MISFSFFDLVASCMAYIYSRYETWPQAWHDIDSLSILLSYTSVAYDINPVWTVHCHKSPHELFPTFACSPKRFIADLTIGPQQQTRRKMYGPLTIHGQPLPLWWKLVFRACSHGNLPASRFLRHTWHGCTIRSAKNDVWPAETRPCKDAST